jgi:hypothetical protein
MPDVVTRAAAAAAGRYAAGGYATVYDGVVGPWYLADFAAAAGLWISYGAVAGIPALVIPNTVALLTGAAVIVVAVRLRRTAENSSQPAGQRARRRLGLTEVARFDHPRVPHGHPLQPHVTCHLARPQGSRPAAKRPHPVSHRH